MTLWKKLSCRVAIAKLEQMSIYLDGMNAVIQADQKQLTADLEALAENRNEEEKAEF
ncbi:hypothetical protein ACN4EK_29885 [Pantanalinema rosaneae CENA516]|uniref:hypothetical protein n=1 Tax=Pantanalinema rosaneae TaxID=1620701 RepID=UPI003D6FF2EF